MFKNLVLAFVFAILLLAGLLCVYVADILRYCPQQSNFQIGVQDELDSSLVRITPENAEHLQLVGSLGHTLAARWAVTFDPQTRFLAAGGKYDSSEPYTWNCGNVWLWDIRHPLETPRVLRSPEGSSIVSNVMFNSSGDLLAVSEGGASGIRNLRLWNMQKGAIEVIEFPKNTTGRSFAFSADGSWLVFGTWDGELKIWDTPTATETILPGHQSGIFTIAISPDSNLIASAGDDAIIQLWHSETLDEAEHLTGHTHYVFRVVFNTSGDKLASTSLDETIRVWDVVSGEQENLFNIGTLNLLFSPIGGFLGTDLGVIDIETSEDQIVFNHRARSISFSPDGELIAAGTKEGIEIWDVGIGILLTLLEFDTSPARDLEFSPDGKFLAAVGSGPDGSVYLWAVSHEP